MNTIILPRAIALQCQLNDTLYNLASISSGDPLYGASFYSTDASSASASGHVIAVISKNVTAAQAEAILTKLTHNATGARIGNNVTISSTAVYLLHLPNDILSAIPTSVMNSGMGGGHYYFDPVHQIFVIFSGITEIAGMIFNFLVFVASGGLLLLFIHLVEIGLEAIGNMLSAAAAAVQDAMDAIVDAFAAFVDWIIVIAIEMMNQLYASVLAPILSLGENSYSSISAAANCVNETGDNDDKSSLSDALYGNLFLSMFILAIGINAVLLALKIISGGMTFLLGTLVTIVVMVLITEILGINPNGDDPGNPNDTSEDSVSAWIVSFFGQQSGADIIVGILNSFWFTIAIIPSMLAWDATGSIGSLAVTLFCLIISFYSLASQDILVNVLLCAICGILIIESFKPIANLDHDLQLIIFGCNTLLAILLISNIVCMVV
ncbi:MAG TPA: hypothetical protein VMW85_04190 [Methanomassiliicoccales archaeon]|nr:hypothetical protein [Methanomassiliicoccales archaeon]